MLPHTFGLPYSTHASLTRYRAGKLSVPSTTTSTPSSSALAFAAENLALKVATRTSGLSAAMRARAESTFDCPTDVVSWTICRCRFVTSTASKSTIPIVPTPAAARYSSAGDPSPPAPTHNTRAAFSVRCPSSPISGSRMWRL
jgi:hypothetical protein